MVRAPGSWLAVIGGFLGILSLLGCSGANELRIGSTTEEPNPRVVDQLAHSLSPTFAVGVRRFDSRAELLAGVQDQTLEFAVVEQPRESLDNVAVVMPLYPSVLHVLVRRTLVTCEAPVPLGDILTAGSVYAGSVGSTGYNLLQDLSQAGWLPDMQEVQLLDSAFGAQPDVFVQFGGILSSDAVSRLTDYCLVSLGDVDQLGRGAWAEGLSYRFPHLQAFVLPGGLYPQLSQRPVLTLAVASLLVTHVEQNVDSVYDVIGRIKEAASAFNAIYPLAGDTIRGQGDDPLYTLPLHSGATRYRQRNAPTFLERYAELLAFMITALVALSSASVFVLRYRRQAKKDRLDTYFDSLLSVRQRANEMDDVDALRHEVRELQRQVTELVVSERIQADSAYVAFVLLSNRVLEELGNRARAQTQPAG